MDISQSFQNALDAVVAFIPRALAFLAILVIGYIVARILRTVAVKLLSKVGFDRVAERGGLRKFTGRYTASGLVGMIVFYAIMLFTLQLAFGAFGNNPVSDLLNAIVAWLPQLFIALVIMVVAMAVANVVYDLVSNMLASVSYGRTVAAIARIAIVVIAAIAALNQIGIGNAVTMPLFITALAIIAGVAIVGLGGGLIMPMRERWERVLGRVEAESASLKAAVSDQQGTPQFGQGAYQSQQYGTDQQSAAQDAARRAEAETAGRVPPPDTGEYGAHQ
ncbi:mechanosensitive ion channel family protein [Phytomonospora endophytica]|uniref:Lysylphosphatidylglycerol synthetase-like protein (DUF2156 family) n=1 Tax=Phytomonospora endophytica TaxID=714109 RepID=A0A841FNN2_9ACTN|nr:hypothetical protein [Phytomonospora endophytica]MBB6038921.1 lysylphosphatidylglycerol synthetase-like protein (DUF2156 family) [Phytomonospora endophytica]GIG67977.1 hypothetical protein Pen01_42720 [Phytomonospora endophytica]